MKDTVLGREFGAESLPRLTKHGPAVWCETCGMWLSGLGQWGRHKRNDMHKKYVNRKRWKLLFKQFLVHCRLPLLALTLSNAANARRNRRGGGIVDRQPEEELPWSLVGSGEVTVLEEDEDWILIPPE